MQKLKSKGIALILVIFIAATLLLLGSALVKVVFSSYTHTAYRLAKLKAFYLAEAAIEYGKAGIANNSNWYTDLVVTDPEKGIGKGMGLGEGHGKAVRERGRNILYGIGYQGKAKSIIKITFGLTPASPAQLGGPFKQLSWEGI